MTLEDFDKSDLLMIDACEARDQAHRRVRLAFDDKYGMFLKCSRCGEPRFTSMSLVLSGFALVHVKPFVCDGGRYAITSYTKYTDQKGTQS